MLIGEQRPQPYPPNAVLQQLDAAPSPSAAHGQASCHHPLDGLNGSVFRASMAPLCLRVIPHPRWRNVLSAGRSIKMTQGSPYADWLTSPKSACGAEITPWTQCWRCGPTTVWPWSRRTPDARSGMVSGVSASLTRSCSVLQANFLPWAHTHPLPWAPTPHPWVLRAPSPLGGGLRGLCRRARTSSPGRW